MPLLPNGFVLRPPRFTVRFGRELPEKEVNMVAAVGWDGGGLCVDRRVKEVGLLWRRRSVVSVLIGEESERRG